MTMGGVPEEMLLPSLPHFAAGSWVMLLLKPEILRSFRPTDDSSDSESCVGSRRGSGWRVKVSSGFISQASVTPFPGLGCGLSLRNTILALSGLSHGGGPLLSIATTSSASGGVFPAHEATKQRTPESQTKRPKKAHSNEEASWSPMATGEMRKAALVDVERGGAGKRKLLQNTEKSY
ncbi:hypothetical protein BHM03_00037983 [Ensete ventricosum]|nr:hypothetical protein BHM03_00037983 [Ensete ventricosum]